MWHDKLNIRGFDNSWICCIRAHCGFRHEIKCTPNINFEGALAKFYTLIRKYAVLHYTMIQWQRGKTCAS